MTRSRRGRGGHGGGGGGGGGHGGGDSRWLVTYADLLTLLMVLFLVLWVISTIDLKKFEQFKGGLGDFGNPSAQKYNAKNIDTGKTNDTTTTTTTIAEGETTTTTSVPSTDPAASTTTVVGGLGPGDGPTLTAEQLVGEMQTLQGSIDKASLNDVVDVHIDERGLVVSVSTDNVLFESGSGSLTSAGAQIIGSVAPDIASLGNKIIVEGYTDNRPLHRTGYDNWDLSVDRAVSVLKVLRDGFHVSPARLAATGYGDQQPIATGNDAASLAKNRRVEIVLVAGPST